MQGVGSLQPCSSCGWWCLAVEESSTGGDFHCEAVFMSQLKFLHCLGKGAVPGSFVSGGPGCGQMFASWKSTTEELQDARGVETTPLPPRRPFSSHSAPGRVEELKGTSASHSACLGRAPVNLPAASIEHCCCASLSPGYSSVSHPCGKPPRTLFCTRPAR